MTGSLAGASLIAVAAALLVGIFIGAFINLLLYRHRFNDETPMTHVLQEAILGLTCGFAASITMIVRSFFGSC